MSPWIRMALALVVFPVGWAVRQAAGGAAGGLVVLGLIAACAAGLPARRALAVVLAGLACFVLVHLVASATALYAGLAAGAILYAAASAGLARERPA